MQVTILSEHGYEEALFGLGLSHGVTSGMDFFDDFCPDEIQLVKYVMEQETYFKGEELQKMKGVAQRLAGKGNGHDKYLRQIMVFLDIEASLNWWKQADTYGVGVVKQSESTMHSLHKTPITKELFDGRVNPAQIAYCEDLRQAYLEHRNQQFWEDLIDNLPMSFKQRRIVSCNYAVLANIFNQRKGHKLGAWATFIDAVRSQCQHPELLP